MLVRNLCDLSKTSSKKSKTHSQLLKVDSVLSAFGNATTPLNQDASCFAQYREVQFDSKGKMVGMKLIEYLLEKSRASGPLDGGKAFHIFYYLLEGATHEERVQWHLSDPAHFSYLTGSSMAGYAQGKGTAPLDLLRSNLKSLGVGRRQQAQLWQILSAILHLGNIQFQDALSDRETCSVRNFPQMQLVAEMLGVSVPALQTVLTSRTRMIGRDNVASYLSAADAANQRDCFARALYQVMFGWIVEQINQKMCAPDAIWSNFVSILEIPGFGGLEQPGNNFYRLIVNYANEKLYSHMMNELFIAPKDAFVTQEIEFPVTFDSNKEILSVLNGPRDGILHLIDNEAVKVNPSIVAPQVYEKHVDSGVLVTASSKNMSHSFGIHHYAGIVDYDSRGFAAIDSDILQTDFVTLVRGNPENPGTSNAFLRSLFSDKLIATRKAGDQSTVVAANARGRTPSLRRKQPKQDEDELLDPTATMGHLFRTQFHSLLDTLGASQPWFVYCIKPFDGTSGKVNVDSIKRQVDGFDLVSMVGNPAAIYTATYPFAEFVARYKPILSLWDRDPKTACEAMIRYKNWKPRDCVIGTTSIFLAEQQWVDLELKLKEKEDAELAKTQPRNSMSSAVPSSRDDSDGFMSNAFSNRKYAESVNGSEISDDTASHYESEFDFGMDRGGAPIDLELGKLPKSKLGEEIKPKAIPPPPPREVTPLRKRWLCCTWTSTWCFFPFCLSCCGGMKERERQLAWREKFALCVIIFFMNITVLFVIIGTGYLICPKDPRFPAQSPGEVSGRFEVDRNAAVYMYGDYYVIPSIVRTHVSAYMDQLSASPEYFRSEVLGRDVTWMFPIQNSAGQSRCRMNVPPQFRLVPDQPPTTKWVQHGTTGGRASALQIYESLKPYRGGPIVVGVDYLQEIVQKNPQTKRYIILNDNAYDLSPFYDLSLNPSQRDSWFLGTYFKDMADFHTRGGQVGDATASFNRLRSLDPNQYNRVRECLDFMFRVGGIDRRNDIQCLIANYILLAASVVLVSVIGFKFFAALQFPGKKTPEDHDKFVICQVPCYTEVSTFNLG
jgi:chitin synthase